MRLPGHAESYNPPPEYVPNENEKQLWESRADEPYKRKLNFLPKKHDCLRKVPMYERFINERFERCLDLYLAPRARKMRLTIQPEDLVPQLPKPHDLQVNFVKNPLYFKKIEFSRQKKYNLPFEQKMCKNFPPFFLQKNINEKLIFERIGGKDF